MSLPLEAATEAAPGGGPTVVALWPVVDRWNHIINGLSVIVDKMRDP